MNKLLILALTILMMACEKESKEDKEVIELPKIIVPVDTVRIVFQVLNAKEHKVIFYKNSTFLKIFYTSSEFKFFYLSQKKDTIEYTIDGNAIKCKLLITKKGHTMTSHRTASGLYSYKW